MLGAFPVPDVPLTFFFLHHLEASEKEIQHTSECLMPYLSLYVASPIRVSLAL